MHLDGFALTREDERLRRPARMAAATLPLRRERTA
jgi:hypothetical protein